MVKPRHETSININTLFVGRMPVAANPSWQRPLECIGLSITFLRTCGSRNARPTCICANYDKWRHPYYISMCAGGGNPQRCTCPNGSNFPVQG